MVCLVKPPDRTTSPDIVKVFVRLGNSEIMFSFVEGKTVW